MFFRYLQHAAKTVLSFVRNQSGSIMVYTGAFMAVGVGGAALSIDVGRIVLLKTQMQNRADAGALAGAAQLDAFPGAIERAEVVITDAMVAYTTAAADQGELAVWDAEFYAVDPNDPNRTQRGAITTDDGQARFAEVVMERRTLSFFYGPALNMLTGKAGDSQTFLDARAVGMSDPFICKMQPLMICNPFDDGDPNTTDPDIRDPAYRGWGLRIKQSGKTGAWQPGNFGLLDLPEDANYGGGGANAVQAALEAEDPLGCYAVATLETAPGNKTGKVKDGVNVRWYAPGPVAPNVINYPKDDSMIADPNISFSTDGVWDIATYWAARHPGVPLPPDLSAAPRYQVYLFEQGQGFWKKGKKTSATVEIDPPDNTGGWTFVDPAAYIADPVYAGLEHPVGSGKALPVDAGSPDDNYLDGVPPSGATVSTKAHERRVMKIAVADCATHSFQGNASIPAEGTYIEIFLTEEAGGANDGATIYGELMGGLEPRTSFEFHGNVRLVE